jgi:hypothetical protein
MKIVYNKETRNEASKFYRSEDWGVEVADDFYKDGFTTIKPPLDTKCDWNESTQSWDIDTSIDQSELDAMIHIEKLAIRRAMRAMGDEEKLNTLLNSSQVFRDDWADSTLINTADPVFLQALAMIDINIDDIKKQILKTS